MAVATLTRSSHSTSAPSAPPSAAPSVADLDADRLHRIALEAFRLGNQGRLKLSESLRALHESKMYLELSYPSIQAYAERFFRFGRTETFETLRVARALDDLTECRAAFLEGRTDWSSLKEITRVATPETEKEWLEFASRHNNVRLRAEVQDAVEKNRDRPRDDRYGLPNIRVQVVLKLTQTEHETLRKGLATLVPGMSKQLGGRDVDLKEVLLYLANRLLSRGPEGAIEPAAPGRALLYHYCPGCRRGKMATEAGMVEVAPEEIERVEGEAKRIAIDAPTPPSLRRKVILRDGTQCSNPWCDNPADHCHHIVHRAKGGRTTLWNETAVCASCHALIHAGLLRIEGDPESGLRWTGRADRIGVNLPEERDRASKIPPIVVNCKHCHGEGSGRKEFSCLNSSPKDWSYLASGLVRLGMRKKEARAWIDRAVEALEAGGKPLTEESILTQALRARGGPVE